MARILEAERETDAALGQDAFPEVVRRLASAAERMGHSYLRGVSPAGHALAGAAAFFSPQLQFWTGGPEPVLLVDGVVVGTAGFSEGAWAARMRGATIVDGLAARFLLDAEPAIPAGLNRLAAFDASGSALDSAAVEDGSRDAV